MLSVICEKRDCFACDNGKCRILTEAIERKSCPFYGTRAEVYDSLASAYVRLKETGREDLIERYGGRTNKKNIEAVDQYCNANYLARFAKAETGSYAAQVYQKYTAEYAEKARNRRGASE